MVNTQSMLENQGIHTIQIKCDVNARCNFDKFNFEKKIPFSLFFLEKI